MDVSSSPGVLEESCYAKSVPSDDEVIADVLLSKIAPELNRRSPLVKKAAFLDFDFPHIWDNVRSKANWPMKNILQLLYF